MPADRFIVNRNMTTHIYGLHDILDPEKTIRYVGQTQQLAKRLQHHKSSSFARRPVRHWVQELKDRGSAPAMIVLESTNEEHKADLLENQWIKRLRPIYNRQLNPEAPKDTISSNQDIYRSQNRDILRLLFLRG